MRKLKKYENIQEMYDDLIQKYAKADFYKENGEIKEEKLNNFFLNRKDFDFSKASINSFEKRYKNIPNMTADMLFLLLASDLAVLSELNKDKVLSRCITWHLTMLEDILKQKQLKNQLIGFGDISFKKFAKAIKENQEV